MSQCTAIASRSGKQCKNPAKLRGKCANHGGRAKIKVNKVAEVPLIGLKAIAQYLSIHHDTLRARYYQELVEAGVIMLRTDKHNVPGNLGRRTAWWTWPSLIQRWVIMRGGIGQHLGRTCINHPFITGQLDKAGFKRAKNPANSKNKRKPGKIRSKPFRGDSDLSDD